MKTLAKIHLFFARRAFNVRREEFYEDLSEAIRDKETLHVFLSNALAYCRQCRMQRRAHIYALMMTRFQEQEGRLGHMLKTIVPDADLLAITAIDGMSGNNERAEGFLRLAQQIVRNKSMKMALSKSVMTSLILLPVIAGFLLLNTKKVAAYERMVPERSSWPVIGQLLGIIADLMKHHGVAIAITCMLLMCLFVMSFKRWYGSLRNRADTVLPYRLYRDTQSTDFLMNMAYLLRSGKQLVEALKLLNPQASPWLQYHIMIMLRRLNNSPDDYANAFDTGLFSPEVHLRMVTYGRRDKNFSAAFIRLGTAGVDYVQKLTISTARKLSLVTICCSVGALTFFYFGDFVTSDAIGEIIKARLTQQGSN